MARFINYLSTGSGDSVPISIAMNNAIDNLYLDSSMNIEEIQAVINSPIIRPRFRVFILHPDESIDYQIPNEDIIEGGSYSENYQSGQRRSVSLTLFNEDGKYTPDINGLWINTKMALELGLEMDDNKTIWFRKGVYVITNISPSQTAEARTVAVSLSDKFAIFEGKLGTLEASYEIPTQSDIEKIIQGIQLVSQGNGYPLDPQKLIYHPSFKGKRTQATISKSAGETYGSILLDLATQLSAEVFYDAAGHLTFIPLDEISGDNDKCVLADLHDIKGDYNGMDFSFDINEVVNRVIVIGATVNGEVYDYTAANEDPSSPLCVSRIGYRTGSVINDSNITSKYLAEERAKYELRKQLILKSSSTLTISFNPLLTVNNLVQIYNEFYGLTGERFIIQSISCNLDYSGTMSVGVANINNLPFISH